MEAYTLETPIENVFLGTTKCMYGTVISRAKTVIKAILSLESFSSWMM